MPPMLHAAMPVEAVTATASVLPRCLRLREAMISRRRTDLPVPGGEGGGRGRSGAGCRARAGGRGREVVEEKEEGRKREAGGEEASEGAERQRRGKGKVKLDAPADPVKNTFFSSSTTIFITTCCSGDRITFCLISIAEEVNIRSFIALETTLPPPNPLRAWKLEEEEPVRESLEEDVEAEEASSSSQGRVRFLGRTEEEEVEADVVAWLKAYAFDGAERIVLVVVVVLLEVGVGRLPNIGASFAPFGGGLKDGFGARGLAVDAPPLPIICAALVLAVLPSPLPLAAAPLPLPLAPGGGTLAFLNAASLSFACAASLLAFPGRALGGVGGQSSSVRVKDEGGLAAVVEVEGLFSRSSEEESSPQLRLG